MVRYDMVVTAEGKDDETVSKLDLMIDPGGAIHTETLCAFPEDEYRKIISDLA